MMENVQKMFRKELCSGNTQILVVNHSITSLNSREKNENFMKEETRET